MALTAKQKSQLLDEYDRNGGKTGKAAANLSLNYVEALNYIALVKAPTMQNLRRPELAKFIVAQKDIDAPWPKNHSGLTQAQFEHDAGLVDMCQYREGSTLYQLAIPRERQEIGRLAYFSRKLCGGEYSGKPGRVIK